MPLIIYTVIQIIGMSVDFCVFLLLVEFHLLSPLLANAVGKLIGVIVAFIGHRQITFRSSALKNDASSATGQALKYSATLPLNILLSSLLLTGFLSLGFVPAFAKLGSDFITFFIFFAANKYLVFK